MPLPSIEVRQQALEAMYGPWRSRTLDQFLDHLAGIYPDREFVVTDERTFTYREMADWAGRISAGLTDLGVRPGEHVAVVLANYPEFVAVKFAIAKAGAVMVPVNFLNRRDELGYVLQQSDAVALITMDRFRDLDYLEALDQLAPGWEQRCSGETFPRLRNIVVLATGGTNVRPGATPFAALEAATPGMPSAGDPASVSDCCNT